MNQTQSRDNLQARQAAVVAERLLTVREVAARLGVSTRQIWKLTGSGQIPASLRLAGSVRWRASDIAAFIGVGCDMRAFRAER